MMHFVGEKLRHWACVATVFALGLSVRYATSWSFTPPADPTRQVLNLNPDRAPEFPTSPAVVFRDREQTTWEVAFATGSVVEDLPPRAAGDEQKLQYGLATVTIPEFRPRGSLTLAKDSGQTRTSSSRTDEITRDPARHMSADEFYTHLDQRLDETTDRNLLVFVHGYNVSFDEAVCRIAQMAQDMPFSGVIVAFDWPSQHKTLGYLQDLSTTARAGQLATVLANLHHRLGPSTRLHVLAHSMGNRLTLKALHALETQRMLLSDGPPPESASHLELLKPQFPGWKPPGLGSRREPPLKHLIFAAPDVDPETFQSELTSIRSAAAQITLYSSDSDFALEVSRIVNLQGQRGYRAGDARSGVQHLGIDAVLLSGVNPTDPFGHSYYGSHPGLLTDLAQLLQKDVPVQQRPTVTAGRWPETGTWRLR